MKNWCKLFGMSLSAVCCTLLMQGAADAAVISKVTSAKTAGIYEKTENVGFNMVLEDVAEDTVYSCQLTGVDNKRLYSEYFTVPQGTTEYYLDLGTFDPGWYKLTVYNTVGGGTAWNKFTAFTVTEPFESRTAAATPFAVDLAGNSVLTAQEKKAYAEALRLMGAEMARERAYWSNTENDYKVIADTVESLEAEGVDTLEVWANSTIPWTGDLTKVYTMQKNYANRFLNEVDAWEIWNEPDIDDVTPDLFAAFYKAAALGVHDADSALLKVFGGLCASSSYYRELLMENELLDYSDVFNVHTHRSGGTGTYYSLASEILENGRILSTLYGGKPLWVTESGIRLPVNSSGNLYSSYLNTQANYVVTSTVEAFDSAGVDKFFYFLARHYIEKEREFGMFSSDGMPYPSTAAYAALTYHLGEANYKGELRYLPDGVKGYMFNNGKEDVAVMWTKSGKSYVQLRANQSVTVVDLVGKVSYRRYDSYHNLVNIPVTTSPIIVKMGCESDPYNYFKKDFPKCEVSQEDEAPLKRVILQPVWPDLKTQNSAYILKSGESYDINVKIYNFSDTAQSGVLMASADNLNIASAMKPFSVNAGSYKTVTFTVSLADGLEGGEFGKLKLSSANPNVSESVCKYMADISERVVDETDKVYFNNFWESSKWAKNTSGTSYNTASNASGQSITFSHTFNGGDRWSYPKYYIEEGSLADAAGLVFDRTITNLTGAGDTKILMWASNGTYIANLSDFAVGTESFVVPWSMFDVYQEGEKEIDPSKINCIAVGMNASSDTPADYTISNFGYFVTDNVQAESTAVKISGIEHNKVYKIGSNLTAKSPVGDGEVSVYLNYEPYYDYEIADGEVTVNMSGLEEGAYSLIISEKDEFNHKAWDEKSFYMGIRVKDRGTFY